MKPEDLDAARAGLEHARHEMIMAWSPNTDEDGTDETARHMLTALLEVELVIGQIKAAEGEPAESRTEISQLAGALASKRGAQ